MKRSWTDFAYERVPSESERGELTTTYTQSEELKTKKLKRTQSQTLSHMLITHTHTCIMAYMDPHTHMHLIQTHTYSRVQTHTRPHTHTLQHTYILTHTRPHTHTHHQHTYILIHRLTHTQTITHASDRHMP